MSGPGILRLWESDEEPPADTEQPHFRQELPSGAATVRADSGGNIVAVEIDPHRIHTVNPQAFTAQLAAAIQQVQQRATNERERARSRNRRRKD